MASQKAFLIDGTAFCYRAFYAIRTLSTADGRPTNAVYGFAMMLQSLLEKKRPDYLAVAFDVGKPTFRHRAFEDYKIQRKPMPDLLIGQLPLVKRLLAAYRIPVFEREGFEAEDVLASLAKRMASATLEVFLVTGDKDALQLITNHIKVYNPHNEDTVWDAQTVRTRYGVGPERMVDLMALMGDDIDNIPGVRGIGEKTATQLLQQFGSLERLYEHLDDVHSPSCRNSLAESKAQVEMARALAQIDADVPLELQPNELKIHEPDWRTLRSLFRELEFKRLLKALDVHTAPTSGSVPTVHMITNLQELAARVSQLASRASHATAMGVWLLGAPVEAILLALATEPDAASFVRIDCAMLKTREGRALATWLADPAAPKILHDAKTAMRKLAQMELSLNGVAGDTMVAAYLLNPARTNQMLSDLSDEYLDQPLSPLPPLEDSAQFLMSSSSEGSQSTNGVPLATTGSRELLEPLSRYVCALLPLHQLLIAKLESQQLMSLYRELELPLVTVLAQMEAVGIAIDLPYLASLHASMESKLMHLTQEIYRLAGCSFNLNSPKQLAQVLFERLKLPVMKRTKTGPSTDSDVLQHLAATHPLPQQLMQYRELAKLVSTYVDALPRLADPTTGRIHTSLNQTATATGRLSSSEPNLQNIPIKTELGRSIRTAFIPGLRDGVLLAADYSQIELRILAHLCGDEHLTEAFRKGLDIHRFTASLIYGVPEAEVQPEQRNAMKAINYGILYGMTSHGLSKELGISFEEAQAFIDAYFERYSKVRGYLDAQIAQAKRDGFVQTLLGRRRYIPDINSPDLAVRQFAERMAVNAPIQGTAADLIKRAMVRVAAQLDAAHFASRMILQVHDELVFEAPRKELLPLMALVRETMEGAIALDVPLTVTLKAGPNWLDLSELK